MAQSHATTPALNPEAEHGKFDEKHAPSDPEKAKPVEEEEEDEDIDALIEDLESQDGHGLEEDEEEGAAPGGARVVPEDMLQTDTRIGSCCGFQSVLCRAELTASAYRSYRPRSNGASSQVSSRCPGSLPGRSPAEMLMPRSADTA